MEKVFYAVFDIHKLHGMTAVRAQDKHNNRAYDMNHVDSDKSYLNVDIVSTEGLSYTQRWREIIRETEAKTGERIKPRKNAVYAYDIVTAFSNGSEQELSIDVDKWCEENRKFMCELFGEENIIAMKLHADETDDVHKTGRRGIHIHTLVVPIDERGKLCARSITGSAGKMKGIQTKYGKAMSQFGLQRGEKNSKIKHTNRRRWYNAVSEICNKKAPRMEKDESLEEYYERLDKEFQDRALSAAKLAENLERKYERSQTRQAQIFEEYAYAVNLQHILEESFEGNMTEVNKRLKTYQIIEKSVPRKNLSVMMDKMLEKYPPENNLAYWRRGKKKKHKKWEDIPDWNGDSALKEDDIARKFVLEQMELLAEESTEEQNLEEIEKSEENKNTDTNNDGIFNVFGEKLED